MLRTLILVVATVSIILAGYGAYTYQEGTVPHPRTQFGEVPTTQPMPDFGGASLSIKQGEVPGGSKPYVEVWGKDGDTKYQFRSTKWEPVSEDKFHLVDPEICVFMPGGEIARVKADHGRVSVERTGGNNINPKRGHFKGNVLIFIDRTDKAWRKANPDLVEPEKHPERIVKIWLDEIRFDLDQSYIKSKGALRVQSTEVEIEGEGLSLFWNERDNRIEELIIEKGKFMELRRGGGMVSFDMPGQERDVAEAKKKVSTPEEKKKARRRLRTAGAMAMASLSDADRDEPRPSAFIRHAVAEGAAANSSLSLEDVYPSKSATSKPGERAGKSGRKPSKLAKRIRIKKRDSSSRIRRRKGQIDTYLAVIEGNVLVEQRRGLKTLGRLGGVDRLEMVFDVGDKQRSAARTKDPTSQPAKEKGAGSSPDKAGAPTTTSAPTTKPANRTRVRLAWNGRLVIRPVEPEAKQTGERFDVQAFGSQVRIMSKQGPDKQAEVVCRRLVFCNQTEQVWLYGGPKQWVRMWSGDTRRLTGQEIFLDRKTGIAVVNGPGKMTDTRAALAAIAISGNKTDDKADPNNTSSDSERVEISWSRQVELDFGMAEIKRVDPATGREFSKSREYIKQAAFRGDVVMKQGDQHIKGDEIVMGFDVPATRKGFIGPILTVQARRGVKLIHQDNEIRSEKLDVKMTVDKHGRNVPLAASAYGNVLAKQGDRYIRAKDLLSVVVGAVVKKGPTTTQASRADLLSRVDPEKVEKLKKRAVLRGIDPARIDALLAREDLSVEVIEAFAVANNIDPKEITKLIEPKSDKPDLSIIEMHAFGDVVAVDQQQKLDLLADELHCKLPDGKNIVRATVIAQPNEQADVVLGDYEIHGHRIEIDLNRQHAEVPGAGRLRFVSRQGLDGRQLDASVPMNVKWSQEMKLEGDKNVGRFIGEVSAWNKTSRLDCDRLRIDFIDVPQAEIDKKKAAPTRRAMIANLLSQGGTLGMTGVSPHKGPDGKPVQPLTTAKAEAVATMLDQMMSWRESSKSKSGLPGGVLRMRFAKKPVHALAEGNAVVVSSMFDKQNEKRLLSRIRIGGPKMSVDLLGEKLDILGAGSLLIEDYRLPTGRKGATGFNRLSQPKDPLMANFSGRGPSQTVFAWANSMSYFMANNLAILDGSVSMIHLSGGALVMADSLAKAMNLDLSQLRMKGRKAALTCENLTVEFLRSASKAGSTSPFDSVGAAELNRLIATGNIFLEDGNRSLVGEELTYYRKSNEIVVIGSKENMGRVFIEDPKTGPLHWRGQEIRWNRNTGQIFLPGAQVNHAGR